MNKICEIVIRLREAGAVQDLDVQSLDMILRRYCANGEMPETLQLALVLAGRAIHLSHVCLDLDVVDAEWVLGEAGKDADGLLPQLQKLCAQLKKKTVRKGWLIEFGAIVGAPEQTETPFVLEGPRLYLRRYFNYENLVKKKLKLLAQTGGSEIGKDKARMIAEMLPDNADARRAAEMAITRRLCVISGGPGTGKTYTAARILHLLDSDCDATGQRMHVKVAAPTGKAAARVEESLRQASASLGDFKHAKIDPACTLERLLGYKHGSPYYRHHADNPLPADVVLIDEASMIDLPKMAKLLDALRADTRLILLGDMHQLASVAPGSVLGDICQNPGLRDCVADLTVSRRFGADTAVGRLSAAVNSVEDDQDAEEAWQLLCELSKVRAAKDAPKRVTVSLHEAPDNFADSDGMINSAFAQAILQGYGAFMAAEDPESVFAALAGFRVLCAMRNGSSGVNAVNALIEKVLAHEAISRKQLGAYMPKRKLKPAAGFYDHRVVMITRNDYGLNLYNGDIGVVLPDPGDQNRLKVFFEKSGNDETGERFRKVGCMILPEHETGFAMTVHKSQGSEFANVLLLLPSRCNRVLSRELIYTGMTRVAGKLDIWVGEDAFIQAVKSRVERFSGLSSFGKI